MFTVRCRASFLRETLLLTCLLLVQCAFFTFIAWHRFVDGDEGFYLLASRLVLEHNRPYLDFFYTQAPLLPYVYGSWMNFLGLTWLSAKFFAALLTALLGTLMSAEVLRLTRRWLSAVVAVVLFAGSTLIFAFFPVVKTYSLSGLLLFSAYVLVSRISSVSSLWVAGAAGLLLGLSVSTRSYLVLTLPVLLWWIVRNSEPSARRGYVLGFLGGFVVGIAPCLYFFAASPRAFLFNNLGYHALRSDGGLLGMWAEKIFALLAVFFSGIEGNGFQTSLLFLTSVVLLGSVPKRQSPPRLAFQMAIGIGLISLLPTPVHPQYFCLCIPFLLLTAVCVVTDYLARAHSRQRKWLAAAVCVLAVAGYVGASVGDFRRYLITGDNVPGLEPGLANDYRLSQVLAVSQAVDQIASPGETVASFWPGYIFQTHTKPLRGLENDFSLPIAAAVNSGERAIYSIVSPDDLETDFAAHHPRVIVLRDHISIPTNVEYRQKVRELEDRFRAAIKTQGYSRVRLVGDVSIHVSRSAD
jgi:hypothetical protein